MSIESELLREILVYDNRGSAYAVAEKAGLAYRTVMDQTDGKVNASVQVIKAAWLVTKDPRLKVILEPEGWELVPKASVLAPTKPIEAEATDVVIEVTSFIAEHRIAIEDGRIDRKEHLDLRKRIQKAKNELEELDKALDGIKVG